MRAATFLRPRRGAPAQKIQASVGHGTQLLWIAPLQHCTSDTQNVRHCNYSRLTVSHLLCRSSRALWFDDCSATRSSVFIYLFIISQPDIAPCRCSCAAFCARKSAADSSLVSSSAGLSFRKTIISNTMPTLPPPCPATDSRSRPSHRFSQTKSPTTC